MAWPDNLDHVDCNFPKAYLYTLKTAIDNGQVKWGRSTGFCEYFSSTFEWAGCEWELDEMTELVTSVRLIKGKIDPEVLTIAVLKGKIDNS